MAANPYPNLGWNPVPGIPSEVESLKSKVDAAARALRTSHQQIERLLGESSHWEGDAADEFRNELDGELPEYMKNAARSLEKAATQLGKWDSSLTSNRELAKKYDDEAKEKKEAAETAKGRHEQAGKDPDLKLGGKQFPSQAEADAATERLRAAEGRLKDARASLEKAQEAYDSVIAKAKTLEKEHEREADKVADSLDEADDKLAPKEPGWLSKTLDSIGEKLAGVGKFLLDHAGTIGAVAGLLALFPTPLAPAFAAIAIVASGASMAKNLLSEDFRASLFGKYGGMEAATAWGSVIGDGLGMVPGVGALSKAGGETIMFAGAAREGGEAMSAGAKAATFGRETVRALDTSGMPKLWEGVANGANVLANGASSLEAEGALPQDGAGHYGAEAVKGGAAVSGGPDAVTEMWSGLGDLRAGLQLL